MVSFDKNTLANAVVMSNSLGVIDLFSGVGGLSLGAVRAGFKLRAAVEIDPHAIASHKTNFPNTLHFAKSVSLLTGKVISELPFKKNELSGIVGGPPCQGFSAIGKQNIDDARNLLFIDFFRLVSELSPRFFVAENVPGIMNEKFSSLRNKAFSFVKKKYVILPPIKLLAHQFGVPTTRERVFFIGYRPDELNPIDEKCFSPPKISPVKVCDALAGLPVKIDPAWQSEEQGWQDVNAPKVKRFARLVRGKVPQGVGDLVAIKRMKTQQLVSGCLGTIHSKEVLQRYSQVSPGETDAISKSYRLTNNGFCPTIRAGTNSEHGSFQAVRPLHPTENRVITPREAARLQGFPDWFQFSPTKWHSFRQIGNSVSPILAEYVLSVLFQAAQ
ncbi:MAG: DNA cytosine methyltransferase [Planctomycetaceae bacterium]|nr:DNA cytosine methyltransferase [Planctomycetaceae bacterium]